MPLLCFGTNTKTHNVSSVISLGHCPLLCRVSCIPFHIFVILHLSFSSHLSYTQSLSFPWQETTAVCHTLCNMVQIGNTLRVFLFLSISIFPICLFVCVFRVCVSDRVRETECKLAEEVTLPRELLLQKVNCRLCVCSRTVTAL